ncbi:MAG TPA: hypothetical protein VLD62_05805 [Acidimicrobiia bacterium]|nr:hypothetical protein [Acidimicrobiia bacterium]
MLDLAERIRSYYEASADPITADEILAPRSSLDAEPPMPRRISGPALAAGVAVVLLVLFGGIALMLRAVTSGGGPAESVPEPTTTAPVVTTVPGSSPTTTAPVVTTVPGSSPTTSAPVVTTTTEAAAIVEVPGASWSDPTELPVRGSAFAPAVDQEGRLVVAFFSPFDNTIKILRCSDVRCSAESDAATLGPAETVLVEGSVQGPGRLSMALRPDGSPIVLVEQGWPTHGRVYACADPECISVASAEFRDPDPCVWPNGVACPSVMQSRIAIAPDGLPMILYQTGSPERLQLAECGDVTCSPESRNTVTIDAAMRGDLGLTLRIDPDGRILIAYDKETPDGVGAATVVVCEGGTCAGGTTTLRFGDGFGPRITALDGGEFAVWYRTGQRFGDEGDPFSFVDVSDIWMTTCTVEGCGDATRVEIAEAWLSSWPVDTRLSAAPDGGIVVAFNYWFPDECASILEVGIASDPLSAAVPDVTGRYQIEGPFDAVVHEGSLLLVFGGRAGDLSVASVPLSEDVPGSFGDELEQCPRLSVGAP